MSIEKSIIRKWRLLGESIQSLSTVETGETPEQQLKRIELVRQDIAAFVSYYFPHYCTDKETGKPIAPAKFHIQAAKEILKNPNLRAVYQWPRGHAKSTYMDIIIPMWLLCQKQRLINVLVLVGKNEDNACTLLGDIQAELQYNKRYIHDFGNQYNAGDWQEGQFVTASGVAFFALGRGQSPRGLRYRSHRPDYIVIDDLDDDELCRNEKRVSDLTNWVKEALFGCFGSDGGRFIMVGNLIAKNSVLQNIMQSNGVKVSKVNILDNKGNPSWKECWTKERVKELESFMGYRAFQKEYMNNPIIEGTVFKKSDIVFGQTLKASQYKSLVCYTDPSFKSSATADYKATALVGITSDGYFHVLKMYAAQTTVAEMVRWHYEIMNFVGNANCRYMIEANFMQDLLLDEFKKEGEARGLHIPITGDKRSKGDKFARIENLQPLFERGLILINEKEKDSPGVAVLIDQLLSFQKGSRAHDDAPDALESAIWQLNRTHRIDSFPVLMHSRKEQRKHWF
ncbi:MAG: phage terminase large subunit [Bacteroidales bacterium]|nr:phage terminase large subunit [Bacteroidales bacterium]